MPNMVIAPTQSPPTARPVSQRPAVAVTPQQARSSWGMSGLRAIAKVLIIASAVLYLQSPEQPTGPLMLPRPTTPTCPNQQPVSTYQPMLPGVPPQLMIAGVASQAMLPGTPARAMLPKPGPLVCEHQPVMYSDPQAKNDSSPEPKAPKTKRIKAKPVKENNEPRNQALGSRISSSITGVSRGTANASNSRIPAPRTNFIRNY